MSLRSQPGVLSRDLVTIQPVKEQMTGDPDVGSPEMLPAGPPVLAYSRKLGSGQAFREGKQDQTVSYRLIIDYRRGQVYPFGEKDGIWHPEASERLLNGQPNYETALEIDSIVSYAEPEGVSVIEAGRTY